MFFGYCHRTRFRDSFCLAIVFEMTVYLLTYLLTFAHTVRETAIKFDQTILEENITGSITPRALAKNVW